MCIRDSLSTLQYRNKEYYLKGLIKKCIIDGKECYCREIFKKVMVKDVILVINMKKGLGMEIIAIKMCIRDREYLVSKDVYSISLTAE